MYLTRCPACATTFRLTREQLHARDGKVRCGACRHVFNAMAHLLDERPAPAAASPMAAGRAVSLTAEAGLPQASSPVATPRQATSLIQLDSLDPLPESGHASEISESLEHLAPAPFTLLETNLTPLPTEPAEDLSPEPHNKPADHPTRAAAAPQEPAPAVVAAHYLPDDSAPDSMANTSAAIVAPAQTASTPQDVQPANPTPGLETEPGSPDTAEQAHISPSPREPKTPPQDPIDAALMDPAQVKQHGLEAGLLAARDLTEIPGFSRWSASPLENLAPPATPRALWPFVLVALLLVLLLAIQAALYFRGPLSRHMPSSVSLFASLGIGVPLPREANQISIEASDLQSDQTPGQLLLLATLRNRAPYAQAWPDLELTLTDTNDAILVRKIIPAGQYRPGSTAASFPPGDTSIELKLNSGLPQAAGYRLYLFYP